MNLSEVYPSLAEVESYWSRASLEVPRDVEPVETVQRPPDFEEPADRYAGGGTWLRFEGIDGVSFWCLWQECRCLGVRRALVHLPGYGTEVSAHPGLVHGGYHVLHVNPRGYCGPNGLGNPDWRDEKGGAAVVLRNLDQPDEYGYRLWFQDALLAVRWLQRQARVNERLGFFGSSQGGAGSLILASILSTEKVVGAVAADVPFMTDFCLAFSQTNRGAYESIFSHLSEDEQAFRQCFRTLGLFDTVIHAPRMTYPVLLTAGDLDETCPSYTIRSLYDELPHTRAMVEFHGQPHGYTPHFLPLAKAWFDTYL